MTEYYQQTLVTNLQ